MVRLYHFNHSCKDCTSGTLFELSPIRIKINSEFAKDYEDLNRAFPDGLSVFGERHIFPDNPCGEAPAEKRELESKCERVRQVYFPHLRSRYQSFFCVYSLEDARNFREFAKSETGISGSIWEIEAQEIQHKGDMRLLVPGRCGLAEIKAYWRGEPLDDKNPIWEYLVIPPVKMVRCIEH